MHATPKGEKTVARRKAMISTAEPDQCATSCNLPKTENTRDGRAAVYTHMSKDKLQHWDSKNYIEPPATHMITEI